MKIMKKNYIFKKIRGRGRYSKTPVPLALSRHKNFGLVLRLPNRIIDRSPVLINVQAVRFEKLNKRPFPNKCQNKLVLFLTLFRPGSENYVKGQGGGGSEDPPSDLEN